MVVEAKICGLMRAGDAALAVRHGAAVLGVVFAGGPRRVTTAQAGEVVAAAGGVPVLGVFGDQSVDTMLAVAEAVGLRGVQLHRSTSIAERERLTAVGLVVWQMLRYGGPEVTKIRSPVGVDLCLLEPWHPLGGGGHGVPGDLRAARQLRDVLTGVRVGLAGGLTPERVTEAIRVVSPSLVDVSSGVEQTPGIKDPVRLVRFLETVRDAGSFI